MTVNWQEPIEAVHKDGRVVPVTLSDRPQPDREGDYLTNEIPDPDTNYWWRADGSDRADGGKWTIRNTPQPHTQPRTAPNGGEVGPEVVERMIVHLRGMAVQYDAGKREIDYAYAKDIVALLPEPVDGDLLEAREIVIECLGMKDHPYSLKIRNGEKDGVCQEALSGIKRGRQLERGGE